MNQEIYNETTSSLLLTSTTQATTQQPIFSSSFLHDSISASFLEQMPSLQPSFANASAIPFPIPLEAPVIQATFPDKDMELMRKMIVMSSNRIYMIHMILWDGRIVIHMFFLGIAVVLKTSRRFQRVSPLFCSEIIPS